MVSRKMENFPGIMIKVKVLFLISAVIICPVCMAQEDNKAADQEINGFSLVQYSDSGDKKWELNGRSAELEENSVKIDDVSILASGDETFLKLKAREGNFDRDESLARLKKDVVLKTTDGITIKTDALNWDAEAKNVFTEEPVNIKRADFEVNGRGATCDLENKTAEVKKDVTANINAAMPAYMAAVSGDRQKTVITCDGPLEINYSKNKASFLNNVKVEDSQGNILADRIDVYFDAGSRRVKCVVARGGVEIINGGNVTYSEKAIYLVDEGRVILPKRPKLVIQSEPNLKPALQ